MLKLRHILLSNKIYYFLLIVCSIICIFRLNSSPKSILDTSTKTIKGVITDNLLTNNTIKLTIKLNHKENIIATYYDNKDENFSNLLSFMKVGNIVELEGKTITITSSRVENTFDYQKYLKIKKINYLFQADKITYLSQSKKPLYSLKNFLISYMNRFESSSYIKMMLLGDSNTVSKNVIASFRENGISHLFAISGTQVSVLAEVVFRLLKKLKLKEKSSYIITNSFIILYLFLTGFQPAVLRAVLFFLLSSINKYHYFYVTNINLFIVTLSLTLLINPYYIYDLGFLYSYLISFSLIFCSSTLEKYRKIKLLFITSLISFLVSIPITLSTFYQFNILSIIYNIFYVPFVNNLLFPLTILTLLFPPLDYLLVIVIKILESTSLFLSHINFGKLIFPSVPFIFYILYLFLLILIYKTKQKKFVLFFLLLLLFHYHKNIIFDSDYLYMLDVGQGDCILIHSHNQNVLIDTGGKRSYQQEENHTLSDNVILPYLKSKGIRSLNYLVLTHGDYDHLGEASNIIAHFKVNNIFINEGKINYYEKQLLTTNRVKVLKQDMTFKVGNFNFMSLNKDLQDENDSSIILYCQNKNYKILLMGDASKKSEQFILNNYELNKIDVLKIGHHGSKTSTSKSLLEKTNPDIALISAGVDNKFNHPHQVTLDTLKKYHVKTYVTSSSGSIEINLSKNIITHFNNLN